MVQLVTSVGTTAADILGSHPNRSYLLVVNMSTNNIFVRFGDTATTTIGIPLYGQGSFWESPDGFFDKVRQASGWGADELNRVSAVASGASSNLQVFER